MRSSRIIGLAASTPMTNITNRATSSPTKMVASSSSCCVKIVGPGLMLLIWKTPRSTADAPLPGMPSTSRWMSAPLTLAVDAACGAMIPEGDPLPSSSLCLPNCFSTPYATNEPTVEPTPGPALTNAPVARPRPDGGQAGDRRAHVRGLLARLAPEALGEPGERLRERIDADQDRQVVDAVAQRVGAEVVAHRAVDVVDAYGREQHAGEQGDQRFDGRVAREREHARQAEQDDREVLGRAEP